MITGLILLGVMTAAVITTIFVKYRAFKAQDGQLQPVPQILGCRVACTAPMTPLRFGAVLLKAADILASTNLYLHSDILQELASSANIVAQVMAWTDRAGQRVGGSTEYYGIQVCSDLSSTFHELVHLMDWRKRGMYLDETATWERAGLRAADEEFRAWLKQNQ